MHIYTVVPVMPKRTGPGRKTEKTLLSCCAQGGITVNVTPFLLSITRPHLRALIDKL
jgi:hypothetical protein